MSRRGSRFEGAASRVISSIAQRGGPVVVGASLAAATFFVFMPIVREAVGSDASFVWVASLAISLLAGLAAAGWSFALVAWMNRNPDSRLVSRGTSLAEVLKACAKTLTDEVYRRAPHGWAHYVKRENPKDDDVTALATAYGLKLNRLLGSPIDPHTEEEIAQVVVDDLRDSGHDLWHSQTQGDESVEISATVLTAVVPALGLGVAQSALAKIDERRNLWPDHTGRHPVFTLTSCISALVAIDPTHQSLPDLLDLLVAVKIQRKKGYAWPASSENGSDPSVAHTARAVTALGRAIAKSPAARKAKYRTAYDEGLDYLLAEDLDKINENQVELIRRDRETARDILQVKHFTSALVLRALAESGEGRHRYREISDAVLDHYRDGAFWWSAKDAPIWMLYQGCASLHAAALVEKMYILPDGSGR
jgi:hypothetical protein